MAKYYHLKRWASGLLIAALLVYFSMNNFRNSSSEEMMGEPTVLVTTAPVIVEDIPMVVDVFGNLRAIDSAAIASEIEGSITELSFTEGQTVKAGDPLIRIDDSLEQALLAQAQAEVELNTVDYQRNESLLARKAVSTQEVDRAKATLDVSLAQLEIAKADLGKTLIKAPFAGQLGEKILSLGQYVTIGQTLVHIVDKSKLILEYNVSEQFLSQVALGQTISLISSAFPDETFTGVVSFISPFIDESTRTLKMEASIDNTDGRLAPGLSVKLQQVLGFKPNGFKIPEESIMPTVEGYRVYINKENKATSVPVEITSRSKGFVYIATGLNADDIVVTRGQEKLRDGATVEIFSEKKEG
jgi:membrane fusion protein (multidrug efflux system)